MQANTIRKLVQVITSRQADGWFVSIFRILVVVVFLGLYQSPNSQNSENIKSWLEEILIKWMIDVFLIDFIRISNCLVEAGIEKVNYLKNIYCFTDQIEKYCLKITF